MPKPRVVDPVLLERKISEEVLPYMGMSDIFVMLPRPQSHFKLPHLMNVQQEICVQFVV